jgi:ABC-type dipeptide/oligopeptide/nickel transport system ATPase subunit
METSKVRIFNDSLAVRERVPLLVGMMGPSGGGKTYSALRVATGIQKVTGGDIFVIDTEANRAKHYADIFKFRHVPFVAPFSPLDYLAAIEQSVKKGAGVVIVDSMSHEHEGPGGLLEMHEAEVQRLSGGDKEKAGRVNFLAWAKPKAERRRLINTILQLNTNLIFCFRAKEKIRIRQRKEEEKEPEQLGWMPIAGEEFLYEMTVNCLLLPSSGGVPSWRSDYRGEMQMMKLPIQFKKIFEEEKPLDESMGEAMAKWAAGDSKPKQLPKASEITGIAIDETSLTLNLIKEFMVRKWPEKTGADAKSKSRAIEVFFEKKSWAEVEAMELNDLQKGFKRLTDELGELKAS